MEKIFECKKCGLEDFEIMESGTQKGLYCASCGSWHKWLGKDELMKYKIAEKRRRAGE